MNLAFLNNFSLFGASDWVLLLVFLAAAFVYGLAMGRSRLAAVTLGVYFSFLVTRVIPWKELKFLGVNSAPPSNVQIFIFLALILGFYFMIPRSAFSFVSQAGRRRQRAGWWWLLVLSVLQIGLVLALVISFLPVKAVAALSPLAAQIFVGPWPSFLWMLMPILAMMFLRGRGYD